MRWKRFQSFLASQDFNISTATGHTVLELAEVIWKRLEEDKIRLNKRRLTRPPSPRRGRFWLKVKWCARDCRGLASFGASSSTTTLGSVPTVCARELVFNWLSAV